MTDAYFVTCQDAGKTGYLLGPFTTEKACKVFAQYPEDNPGSRLSEVVDSCTAIDRRAHFFSFGMCKIRDFEQCTIKGLLNRIDPAKWDRVIL